MPWETGARTPAYDTAEYKRARLACLKKANWRCERRIPGVCIGAASQANHRSQLATDPHHLDLEAICGPCHKVVTAEQGGGYRRPRDPQPTPRTAW